MGKTNLGDFVRKALVVLALAAGTFVAWRLRSVLLLLFAAVVFALLLRGIAGPLQKRTRLPARLSVAITTLALVVVIAAALAFFGFSIEAQLSDIADRLPGAWATLQEKLMGSPLGARILETVRGFSPGAELIGKVSPYLAGFANATGNVLLVLVAGLYLALEPDLYRRGIEGLASGRARAQLAAILDEIGTTLQSWLLAQGLGMLSVGLLTWIGLRIVGVPEAAALGLLTGLADFVPLVGPLVAGALAVILAVPLGFDRAGWTVLVFVVVQQLEGNLILPVFQRRIVSLPPVVTLFALVAFGVLFGPLGVLLATPLTAAIFAGVRRWRLDREEGEGANAPSAAGGSP